MHHHSGKLRCLIALGALLPVAPPLRAADVATPAAVKPPTPVPPVDTVWPLAGPRLDLFDHDNRFFAPELDLTTLLAEDAAQEGIRPLRIGVVQLAGVDSSTDGRWTQLPNDGWLWTMSFAAPTAKGLKLGIGPWRPPAGAQLLVYNALNPDECFGPFASAAHAGRGTFWTPTIFGKELCVEYYVPPNVDHRAAARLEVAQLTQLYRALADSGGGMATELGCHLDVMCYSDWVSEANGVGVVAFNRGWYAWICSGAMLNRDPTDFTALFMTATHCGIDAGDVDTVEVFWFYQTDECDDPAPPRPPHNYPRSLGRTVLVRDVVTDWTLLELSDDAPGGLTFLGWDAGTWSNNSEAIGIHHPDCRYKRISFGIKESNDGLRPDPDNPPHCTSGTAYYVEWDEGLIEPGSSGSPVFDASHRVRGVLSCGTWSCNPYSGTADYGRLDQSFPLVEPWLLPTDPIYVDGGFSGDERGTESNPFNTVAEAKAAVIRGSTIHIEAGSYAEQFTIDRAMTLRSRHGTATIGE